MHKHGGLSWVHNIPHYFALRKHHELCLFVNIARHTKALPCWHNAPQRKWWRKFNFDKLMHERSLVEVRNSHSFNWNFLNMLPKSVSKVSYKGRGNQWRDHRLYFTLNRQWTPLQVHLNKDLLPNPALGMKNLRKYTSPNTITCLTLILNYKRIMC